MIKRALGVLLTAAAVAVMIPVGCRNVLGIQELGSDQLTCDVYCDTVGKACSGTRAQYESREACMALCPTIPVGTLQDRAGNTLGCRLTLAANIAATGEGECAAAGPGGAGQCGADCDAVCVSALAICPTDFTSMADCQAQCSPLLTCGPFHVVAGVTPDDGSVQCRLYHVTSAAIDAPTHCPHVMGKGLCIAGVKGCPDADAGADGG